LLLTVNEKPNMQTRPNNREVIFCGYREEGLWWFRIFGVGIHWKDVRTHKPLFSERNGLTWHLRIGHWSFGFLKRIKREPASVHLPYSGRFCIPPWSKDQVAALNRYQREGWMHPFTCGSGNRTDEHHLDGEGKLVATKDGWICPYCPYTQDWAFDFMFKPRPW
jgi:hypothetical protein